MYFLTKLSSLVIATAISLGVISTPVVQQVPKDYSQEIAQLQQSVAALSKAPVLGSNVPTTPALYDSYLASGISKTDTTMTLATGVLKNGTSLSGFMCFVIDDNQPTVEYVCGTAAGTTVTGLSRGVDVLNPNTTSTSFAYTHRRFASVSVSDYPTIQFLVRKVNGTEAFDSPILYSFASTSLTSPYHLVDKDYVDALAFQTAGIINANTTAKGVVEIATQIESASSTPTGETGAALVIPASSATSTFNSATAGLTIVSTQNNGKIDAGFIATSSSQTSNNVVPFQNMIFTGTTTLATTTIANLYPSGVIATQYATGTKNITISNIPAIDNLKLFVFASSTATTGFYITFNGDASANYSVTSQNPSCSNYGNGTGLTSITLDGCNSSIMASMVTMDILNVPTAYKFTKSSGITRAATITANLATSTVAGMWLNSTSRITTINIGGNAIQGNSYVKLYGDQF